MVRCIHRFRFRFGEMNWWWHHKNGIFYLRSTFHICTQSHYCLFDACSIDVDAMDEIEELSNQKKTMFLFACSLNCLMQTASNIVLVKNHVHFWLIFFFVLSFDATAPRRASGIVFVCLCVRRNKFILCWFASFGTIEWMTKVFFFLHRPLRQKITQNYEEICMK